MNVTIYYDDSGRISAAIARSAGSGSVHISIPNMPPMRSVDVSIESLPEELGPKEIFKRLERIKSEQRVEVVEGAARLMTRSKAS